MTPTAEEFDLIRRYNDAYLALQDKLHGHLSRSEDCTVAIPSPYQGRMYVLTFSWLDGHLTVKRSMVVTEEVNVRPAGS